MKWLIIAFALVFISVPVLAQTAEPEVTGFAVSPSVTNQYRPVALMFELANNTDRTVYSQVPYSGSTYSLYQPFHDRGLVALPNRYMLGVSLDGGRDRYPYRWGFRGSLLPGNRTTVMGRLALLEVGTYEITTALLKGGEVVTGSTRTASITVEVCARTPVPKPLPVDPIIHYAYGRQLHPPIVPYVVGGHLLVPARQFVYTLGARAYFINGALVIRSKGVELTILPGSQVALVNGYPIRFPIPSYNIGGVTYIPPRFISPIFGATVYWDPHSRLLFIQGPDFY